MATKETKALKQNLTKNMDEVHAKAIKTSDNIIDSTIHTAEQWQKLMSKAVKNSQPLIEKQKDIVFDALKTIKSQYKKGKTQVNTLIGKDIQDAMDQAAKVAKKTVTNSAKKANALAKEATATAEKLNKNFSKAGKTVINNVSESAGIVADLTIGRDDLKKINGIGPKVAELLENAGITNYATLATTSIAELKAILERAGSRYSLIDATLWPQEAQKLSK